MFRARVLLFLLGMLLLCWAFIILFYFVNFWVYLVRCSDLYLEESSKRSLELIETELCIYLNNSNQSY